MARNVWEKIEWIRQQPEPIRVRYVFVCLVVSMAFVIGIWLLSLKESFRHIGKDVPAAVEKGKEFVPDGQAPSLNDLLEQAAPLRAGEQENKTGEEYFNERFQSRSQGNADEGMTENQPNQ